MEPYWKRPQQMGRRGGCLYWGQRAQLKGTSRFEQKGEGRKKFQWQGRIVKKNGQGGVLYLNLIQEPKCRWRDERNARASGVGKMGDAL